MNRLIVIQTVLSALLLSMAPTRAADQGKLFDRPRAVAGPLFEDNVVAKGKGFEIKQSQIDDMFLAFKGHRAAMGVAIPEDARAKIEADILEKLIATRLFVQRATEQDKAKAKEVADVFIAEQKKQTLSEESFKRQLVAVGMTPAEFDAQIREQAIVKVVIDREIKAKQSVNDPDAKKFYDENPTLFQEPELVRTGHILISTRDPITGKDVTPEFKLEKKQLAAKVLARARAGEDFGKLVREFSQDAATKDKGGEYTFPRAKDDPRRAMIPELESAAFSMKVNQISDLVETAYGFHIIKTLEKIPARKIPFAEVEARIKENLQRDQVEKALPEFVEKMKKEAGVKIMASGDTK